MASISTSTPLREIRDLDRGARRRLGADVLRRRPRSSAAKSSRSARKIVVFRSCFRLEPASSRMAWRFCMTCSVCSSMPPSTTSCVSGSMPSWPETKTSSPKLIPCEYGAPWNGAGARSVRTTSLQMDHGADPMPRRARSRRRGRGAARRSARSRGRSGRCSRSSTCPRRRGRDQHRHAGADVRALHPLAVELRRAVHDRPVRVAEDDPRAHVDELVDEEQAVLEHLLEDQHRALGLRRDGEGDRREVGRERRARGRPRSSGSASRGRRG